MSSDGYFLVVHEVYLYPCQMIDAETAEEIRANYERYRVSAGGY